MARKTTLIETSDRWIAVLQWLEAHGGLDNDGVRIRRDEFSKAVCIPERSLTTLLRRMEQRGVIHVQRTTTDGSFGAPRGPNIYRVLVTADEWEKRAEHLERELLAEINERKAKASRDYHRGLRAKREPAPPAVSASVIEVMATEHLAESDDDLYGW